MKDLYLLDASGYIYRSYFAIRQMTNNRGESTNAIFGFIRSYHKLVKDFHPTYLACVFDGPSNSQSRTALYADYKAHRQSMPDDLLYQIDWAKEYCNLMGIPVLQVPGVEADDTMGSIANWAAAEGSTVYICTSDKDMCQLVNNKIFILNTHKENLILNPEGVEKQFGVPPQKMIDYLAIVGDASDNVPGLPGFGPKTACELLQKLGSLDYILAHPQEVPGTKKQETIVQFRDQALLSRQLVTIDLSVEFPKETDFFLLKQPDLENLKSFYMDLNLASLVKELEELKPKPTGTGKDLDVHYEKVDDEDALNQLVAYLSTQKEVCLDTETTNVNPFLAELVGIGFGVEAKKAWYIPVNGTLGLTKVLNALKGLLENPSIGFYGHNIKYDAHVLGNYGIQIANISFDTILGSYLLNSHLRQHSLDRLSLELLGKVKIPIEELIGKGKKEISMFDVPIEKVVEYCCEDIDYTIRIKHILEALMKERNLTSLLQDLELPLLKVLVDMERTGIFLDVPYLHTLAIKVNEEIHRLEKEIYALAGGEFNINSPKQLSEILFVKMQIKPPKKTATGHSTNAEVLESLQREHPIAGKILEYRTVEKLRSTYIESLPLNVNPKTHRIHCSFNQSLTATGRLSCQDPNLQNIPVRTKIGQEVRGAFRPQNEGWSFLAADYSQLELRILAHMSEDPALLDAFAKNEDIHALTASLIFNIPLWTVSKEDRYQAKAVNFGIIYGQQSYGLSQLLGITPKVAAEFIRMYFLRYPKVKEFLESRKALAKETGKAVTLNGRERLIPDIHSPNAMVRAAAERLAVNTPIQGTEADLIKIAMLDIDKRLRVSGKKTKMLLQIHDELLFEVPNEELPEVEKIIRECMQGAMNLKVPLLVDIHIGKNWQEC